MEAGRSESHRLTVVGGQLQPLGSPATITLHVPARPEALGIVRLILMSCGAAAGVAVDEIFARSHEVADAFANILVEQPEATSVVIRTQAGAADFEVVPVTNPEVGPRA